MLVIRKMEAAEKRAACSLLGLAPAVSTVMANAETNKIIGTENYKIARIKCKVHWKLFHKKWNTYTIGKGKGKEIPLQVWTGTEGSRRLRLPDFNTFDTCR
jgi:hypothetical protein